MSCERARLADLSSHYTLCEGTSLFGEALARIHVSTGPLLLPAHRLHCGMYEHNYICVLFVIGCNIDFPVLSAVMLLFRRATMIETIAYECNFGCLDAVHRMTVLTTTRSYRHSFVLLTHLSGIAASSVERV